MSTAQDLARLLATFTESLTNVAPAVAHALRPGLLVDDLEELANEAHLTLPDEARAWWTWSDGIGRLPGGAPATVGRLHLLSFRDALTVRGRERESATTHMQPGEPISGDRYFARSWLPLAMTEGIAVLDCDVPPGEPSPVRFVDWGRDLESDKPKLPSVAALVKLWTDALERGTWEYDSAANHWKVPQDRPAGLLGS
jgi:cell wall assembly regulator SMI1